MTATFRDAVVLLVTGIFFLGAAFYGVQLFTADAETTVATEEQCERRTVRKGDDITPNLVSVDVYNASQRAGLANRVSINLQRRGFLGGEVANSESEVAPRQVTILTNKRRSPQVRLVAQQFPKVTFSPPDVQIDDGITVIIGDGFRGLKKRQNAPKGITVQQPIRVCLPSVTLP